MAYYRIKCDTNLPIYVQADTAAKALQRVESVTGPLPRNLTRVKEVQLSEIPEGTDLW